MPSRSDLSGVARWVSARPSGLSGAGRQRGGLGGVHGVALAVDVEVEPRDDEVLVKRRVRALVDHGPVRRRAVGERRGHHDPGGADLALDVPVLVKAPVHEVLVVRDGRVERDDEPAHPPRLRAGALVDVLPQHPVVLLVDADRVLDRVRLAARVVQDRVEVGDLAEAVAAELERGGHQPEPPLADVERGAAVVVGRRVAVGHDHLGERQPVGDLAHAAAVLVAEGVDHEALAVVEAEPHRPLLPVQLVAVERERRAVGLGYLERPHVVAQLQSGNESRARTRP